MKFHIKNLSKYCEVAITHDNTRIELGILDDEDRMELATELECAISALLNIDEYKKLMDKD